MYLDLFRHNHFNQNNDPGRHFELSYVFATGGNTTIHGSDRANRDDMLLELELVFI